ncbi:MAG: hypothetical protein ACRCZF_24545 [Gemmataceae bacterium]
MGIVDDQTVLSGNGELDALSFLQHAGSEELLSFLRRLPMIAGNADSKFTLADFIYEVKLWPFVREAWKIVPGQPGIPGRLTQIAQVYKLAGENLKKLTGEIRRVPRVINLEAFIAMYTTEGLP